MKKLLLSIITITTLTIASFGQAPEAFKYQAVVRDASSAILSNQSVGIQLTILQDSIGGTAVYTETFAVTTNTYGLVNLEIGTGTTADDFTLIDWANGPFFIETSVDISGGVNYSVMGTSQLMSVPYALYAKTSGSSTPGPQGPQGPQGNDGAPGTNFFSNMQGGKVDIGNVVNPNTLKVVSVAFATPFTTVPSVVCTASAQPGTIFDDSFNLTTRNITTTGFEIVVNRVDGDWWGQDVDAHWLAFD